MQEPPNDQARQPVGTDGLSAPKKAEWQTPTVTEISRFDILSLGPTPGTTENSTFSDKSG